MSKICFSEGALAAGVVAGAVSSGMGLVAGRSLSKSVDFLAAFGLTAVVATLGALSGYAAADRATDDKPLEWGKGVEFESRQNFDFSWVSAAVLAGIVSAAVMSSGTKKSVPSDLP